MVIHVGVGVNDTGAEVYYADQLGFFKKRNLDVRLQSMRSGPAQAAAVAGGAVDIAETNVVSLALAHERGLPFGYIAPAAVYSTDAPTTVLVAAKNSVLRSAKDLNGKTVGVVALHDLTNLGAFAWIEKNGGDASSVKFVEMPAAEMNAGLKRGTIDAATIPEPALGLALVENRILAKNFDAIAPHFMLNGWFTTTDWAKKNPAAAKAFADAILEAARWANGNQKASAEIFKKHSVIEPAVIDRMTRASFGERLDAALLQPLIDAAAKAKYIKQSFPAGDIIITA